MRLRKFSSIWVIYRISISIRVFFPDTGAALTDERFSFVHLDVDIYESTIGSLEWFYPRMLRGGIIISHDFMTAAGPRKAFTEFFERLPEPLIELPGNQGMIVKV